MTVLRERIAWRLARKPSPVAPLKPEEVAHVRAALRVLRQRYGGNARLAKALGCSWSTVSQALRRRLPSASLAVRVAELAGVTTSKVLSGAWPPPGMCPHCGQTRPEGRA